MGQGERVSARPGQTQHLWALSPVVVSATSETARPPWNEAPGHLSASLLSSPAHAWVASLSPQGPLSPVLRAALGRAFCREEPPCRTLLGLPWGPWIFVLKGPLARIQYWELEFARGDLWLRPQQASYGHSRSLCPPGWEEKPGDPGYSDQRRPLEVGPPACGEELGSSKP